MNEPNCYTYFNITGNFDLEDVIKTLGLPPYKSWKKEDIRNDGKPFGFDNLMICRNETYNPYVYVMMEKTIEPLLGKIKELKEIKEKYDVKYYLVVVPSLNSEEANPAISPSLKVIDFCHEVRCELDIDCYVY